MNLLFQRTSMLYSKKSEKAERLFEIQGAGSLRNGGLMGKKSDQKTETCQETRVRRNYKDTVFCMLYRDKSELLELYNAVNDTNYSDPEELEVATLENAVYLSMKNDVSCVVDLRLNLYEHQSTVNPNMPLRDLFYVAKQYEKMIQKEHLDLYSSKRIWIPSPRFVVFYNGTEEQPERKILRLSESFYHRTDEVNLELVVLQLNINPGYNGELLGKCCSLYDYMQYVDRIRRYSSQMAFEEAVEKAVSDCIREGILKEFLVANRAEVVQMSIFEYDEELHMATVWGEGREEGLAEGLEKGREEGLAKGREEGLAEGLAKGREEGAAWGRRLLAGMRKRGMSLEEISELTEEPVETI